GVLRVEDLVALLDVDGLALAVIEDAARTHGQDLALLRLLLDGVREDDAALGHLLARGGLDHDPIAQRAKLRRGSGGGGQRAILLGRRNGAVVAARWAGTFGRADESRSDVVRCRRGRVKGVRAGCRCCPGAAAPVRPPPPPDPWRAALALSM